MSSRNDVYEEQCERWHNDLLNDFESNNTNNLMARLDEIENVVNGECNKYSLTYNGFKIGLKQRQNLITLINKDLREHTVVSHLKCATEIRSVKEYKSKARNKLNRWKPKVFGDHVLCEIIFINTYNYCYEIGRSYRCSWEDTDISNLFLTIFCKLLSAKIRFIKTRDVALILPTVFTTNTQFRRSCIYLLQHYNEADSWNIKGGKKAAEKAYSLKKCLEKILHTTNTIAMPPPIIMTHMNITEMDMKCNVFYMHIIKDIIIAFENEEYMHYYQRLSSYTDCNFISLINEYVCGSMSFWTVTPQKPVQFMYHDDDDGDIIIDTPHYIIPLTFHCPLMNNNSYCSSSSLSLSGGTSGSSITDDQLHNLPVLSDGNNLMPVISGMEMDYNQMEVDQHYLYANSQAIINTPHIRQQLPPPVHTTDNYIHYQPINPHISQQLPPPPPVNTFGNVPQYYNHSQSQPVHNNFNANHSQFGFVGNNYNDGSYYGPSFECNTCNSVMMDYNSLPMYNDEQESMNAMDCSYNCNYALNDMEL